MSTALRVTLMSAMLGALALSGCFCGGPQLPDPPADCDAEGVGCLPDEQCVEGKCVKFEQCNDDSDCVSDHYRCAFPAQICELRPGFDLECESQNDCEAGEICALGMCRDRDELRECTSRGDCPQGEGCSPIHLVCIPEAPCTLAETFPEVGCDFTETCDPVSERCVLPCQNQCTVETEEEDCGVGMHCDAACRCVQCLTDLDCGEGLVCNVRAGRCESENLCFSDDDCEEPLICEPTTLLCQIPPPPCQDDLDCPIAEICNRITGICELPGGACIDDRFEDADTPAQAEEINLPLDGVEVVLDELQLCPDDDDVYAIALAPGDNLQATVSGTAPLARATVWMLDPEGETSVAFADAPPYGNGTVSYVAQTEETVFVRVNALVGATPYEMALTRNPGEPCQPDLWEGETGNDTQETATASGAFPLGQTLVGALCPGDIDRFNVDLLAGEGVDLVLDFDEALADFDIELIDAVTGEQLDLAAGIAAPEPLRYRTQSDRTLQVVIRSFANTNGAWTLAFDKLDPFDCEPDAFEPDDAVADAIAVAAGMSVVDAERTLCAAERDTYRVPLLDFERVVASATFAPSDLDVTIQVLNAAGDTVLRESPNAGGIETVTYNATGNEEVLVRFVSELNTQGAYVANVFRENQLDCAPDVAEPNDTPATAVAAPDGITTLSICGSDNDWFTVEGIEGKRLIARASFLHADGDLDVMIMGQNGTQLLATSDSVSNYEEAEVELPIDGTYHVRVFSLSEGAAARYTLEIELAN
jgi:hypothetical protein